MARGQLPGRMQRDVNLPQLPPPAVALREYLMLTAPELLAP